MDDSDPREFGGAWTRPPTWRRALRTVARRAVLDRTAWALARGRYYVLVSHYALGRWPALFYPLYALREGRESPHPVRPETELVIEGYPRSGSTFAVHAFRLAQGRAVRTADHIHVPAQIMRAAAYGVPACVLVRRPEEVVRSLAVKYPELGIAHALKGYIAYHAACWDYRDRFVVADFETVTRDLASVIEAVNRRFGTRFARFDHTAADLARVFAQLDQRNTVVNVGEALASYRPNGTKEAAKGRLDLSKHAGLLRRAERWYEAYLGLARRESAPVGRPARSR